MITSEFVRTLAERHIAGSDKFIISAKVKPWNKIIVLIDADSSVTIDDCVKLSRFIESNLERDKEDFEIEVSSAGLDFPLVSVRQYKKHTGKEVKVILKNGTVKKGILENINDKGFDISETVTEKINKKKEIITTKETLAFEEVKETKVVIKI